ncbi:MAG: amidohydrolase family protein [Oscillospiraceae bacterium]|jgi:predicted TIM-barrel fold metal-dependent hydrolase
MILDMFAHIRGPKYSAELKRRVGDDGIGGGNPIRDSLEGRFESIEKQCPEGYTSVISTMMENIPRLEDEIALAKTANDEYVELMEKYPKYFCGAAALLPTSDMKEAVKEARRAIEELKLSGFLVGSHVCGDLLGHEKMFDLYEMAAHYDVPIWIHPYHRFPHVDFGPFDYACETAKTMMDLSTSGVFERFPNIKFIAHHGGGVVPLLYPRMIAMYYCVEDKGIMKALEEQSDNQLKGPAGKKGKVPEWSVEQGMKYFQNLKSFYVDTAFDGVCPDVLELRLKFFGVDKFVFGADFPGGPTSDKAIAEAKFNIDSQNISVEDKKKIFYENGKKLLKLDAI